MNTNLPHRFRESSFRPYEHTIASILEVFPQVITIKPECSLETFSCRLRDAIKSLRANQWDTKIDMQKFIQCCDEIVVSIQGEFIMIGNDETLKAAKNKAVGFRMGWSEKKNDERFVELSRVPSLDEFHILCTQSASRIFKNPLLIEFEMNLADKKYFEDKYDVAIEIRPDGKTAIF